MQLPQSGCFLHNIMDVPLSGSDDDDDDDDDDVVKKCSLNFFIFTYLNMFSVNF